jgi:hypothetical protein
MKFAKQSSLFAAAAMTVAMSSLATPASAFDLDQFGRELQAGSDFLATQRWGPQKPQKTSQSRTIVRNETRKAYAGWEKEIGIRWAIDHDCRPRQFTVSVVQQPRYGKVHIRPVNMTIPRRSINAGNQKTMRRCAGLPTIGQGIYYTPPAGHGHYNDYFAVKTSTGLRFNYEVQVENPKG